MGFGTSKIRNFMCEVTDTLLWGDGWYRKKIQLDFTFSKPKMEQERHGKVSPVQWISGPSRVPRIHNLSTGSCFSALLHSCASVFEPTVPELLKRESRFYFMFSSLTGLDFLWQRFNGICKKGGIREVSKQKSRTKTRIVQLAASIEKNISENVFNNMEIVYALYWEKWVVD